MAPKFKINAGDLMLLVIAGFWGATYLVVKLLGQAGTIGGLMTIRFVIASVVLWLYWFFRRDRFQKGELIFGSIFGFSQAIVLNLEAQGVHYTSATNGGLIIALSVITIPILESAWRKKWLPGRFFVAAVLAVLGLVLLVMGNGFVQPNIGDLFMLIAMTLRTVHFVWLGRINDGKNYSPVNLTLMMVSVSALIELVISPGEALATAAQYDLTNWMQMLFLSVICTSAAFIGINWAVKHTSATRATLLLGTEPVWSTILAVFIGGELIGPIGVIGALTIIGATYWGQAIEAKHRG